MKSVPERDHQGLREEGQGGSAPLERHAVRGEGLRQCSSSSSARAITRAAKIHSGTEHLFSSPSSSCRQILILILILILVLVQQLRHRCDARFVRNVRRTATRSSRSRRPMQFAENTFPCSSRGADLSINARVSLPQLCGVCQELSSSACASGALRGAEERWGSGWVQGVTTTRVWCSANKVVSTLIARVLKNKNCPRQESYLRPTHDQKSKKKLCSEHVVGRTRTYASNEIR